MNCIDEMEIEEAMEERGQNKQRNFEMDMERIDWNVWGAVMAWLKSLFSL